MTLRVLTAGAAAIALLAISQTASATTVIYSGQVATAIDGLVVDGKTYNVTFDQSYSTAFEGSPSGALDATNAIDAALNGTTAVYVNVPGLGNTLAFTVEDSGDFGVSGANSGSAGTWHLFSTNFDDQSVAQFTAVSGVPEPAIWAMMLLGCFSLGAALRHRRADRSAAIAA